MRIEYEDVNCDVWRIDRSIVVKDMQDWAANNEESGSFGVCITTQDVLDWVNDNGPSIDGWVWVENTRGKPVPDIPVTVATVVQPPHAGETE